MVLKLLLFVLMLQLTGCTSLGYYGQAIKGQVEILTKRQSVDNLLQDPATPEPLKQKLLRVQEIRNFAHQQMQLPDNGSFNSYVDLQRPYVVWNVFAAPEFSLDPVRWCFPITGCLAYRGYFRKQSAEQFAAELKQPQTDAQQNNDVYVAGVHAYSTLGWFSDPLLSTVIDWPETKLAGLVFHELAHQLVYIKGDTEFNESLAAMIEQEGMRRWLLDNDDRENSNTNLQAYLQGKNRQHAFIKLIMRYRVRLSELYATVHIDSVLPENRQTQFGKMRTAKQTVYTEMRADYQQLKTSWSGYSGYDAWMSEDLNNAKIASVVLYQKYVSAFQALLKQHNGKLPEFYQAVKRISEMESEQRSEVMRGLDSDLQ